MAGDIPAYSRQTGDAGKGTEQGAGNSREGSGEDLQPLTSDFARGGRQPTHRGSQRRAASAVADLFFYYPNSRDDVCWGFSMYAGAGLHTCEVARLRGRRGEAGTGDDGLIGKLGGVLKRWTEF